MNGQLLAAVASAPSARYLWDIRYIDAPVRGLSDADGQSSRR